VERIEHLAAPHPPPPGHRHTIALVGQSVDGMRIGRDDEAQTSRAGRADPPGLEAEPARIAVDLDRRAARSRGVENLLDPALDGRPRQHEPAEGMPPDLE